MKPQRELVPPAAPPFAAYLGMTGLFAFAFFAFLGLAGANIAIAVMFVAAMLDGRRFLRSLRADPAVWLLGWVLAAAAVGVLFRTSQHPGEMPEQLKGLRDLAQLLLFLLVAWWLQGRQRLIVAALAAALVGFALGVVRTLDAASLAELVSWQRPHFKWSINAFGQYAASCLVGMAIFTPRYRRWLGASRLWPLGMLAWFGLMGLAAMGVAWSLSRGVWLSLAIVAAALVVFLWRARWRGSASPRLAATVAATGVLAVGGLLFASDDIRGRLADIAQPVAEFWSSAGRVETLSDDSDRIRAKLLVLGWETWRDAPWFGAGPVSQHAIINASPGYFPDGASYNDFHNVVVDIFAGLGIVGGLPLIATFVLVLWVAHRGYRLGRIDLDVFLVLAGLLVLGALAQMTDTRILTSHGRFYWMLFAGGAYSWWLTARSGRPGNP